MNPNICASCSNMVQVMGEAPVLTAAVVKQEPSEGKALQKRRYGQRTNGRA
jgi:hypothetical protein